MTSFSSDVHDSEGHETDESDAGESHGQSGIPTITNPKATLEFAFGWLFGLLGLLIGSWTIRDNSFLTHLTTGDLIRFQGSVPSVDMYSYTAAGEPWTVQSWLASVVYSVLGELGGGFAIRLLNGVLVGFLALIIWQLSRPARPLIARLVIVGPLIVIGSSQWTPRPLLFGLLGFALVLQVLQEQRSIRWLVPVMWIWVNAHGSFPLAFVLIATFGVGRFLDDRSATQTEMTLPTFEIRVFAWAFVGLLSAMLNPIGPRLLFFPVKLLANREALNGVGEWQPPNFDSLSEWLFLGMVFALILAARAGARWRGILPGIVFAVSGFLAMRNLGTATMVLMVAIAPTCQWRGSLRGHEQGFLPRAMLALSAIGMLVSLPFINRNQSLALDRYPVAEVDWLEDRGLIAEQGVNIIHRDVVGNYLHYRFGLDARVFVDDRFDMYPQEVLDDHITFINGGDFSEALSRYDANVVLWRNVGGFAEWLEASDSWTIAYKGEDWLIALPSEQ